MGLFLLLEGAPPDVNSRICFRLDEEKICVVLTMISTKYEVNRMGKGDYQTLLQSIQLHFLFFWIILSIFDKFLSLP